jgi:hypothetical protein
MEPIMNVLYFRYEKLGSGVRIFILHATVNRLQGMTLV